MIKVTTLAMFLLVSHAALALPQRDYRFDGSITSTVLENYLSRAVQCLGMCADAAGHGSAFFDDDLRMVRHLDAKFIGRAAYGWDLRMSEDQHFDEARAKAQRIHAKDPDIILQACIFEIVHTSATTPAGLPKFGVDTADVPAWVFEEFELPVEKRKFQYEAMLFPGNRFRDLWDKEASVPDITRPETQLWFYYRARRYIDAGYEAIHFGQATFIGLDDTVHSAWEGLLKRVRKYAASHARRHYVLCDAHLPVDRHESPFLVDGKLLWDLASFPLRPVETSTPLRAELHVGHVDAMYQRVPGGKHPSGWDCPVIPQLYEFDNCAAGLTTQTNATIWGADESTWFANLPAAERNRFLTYAYDWVWKNSPHGYLQMPGRRPAHIRAVDATPRYHMYMMNTRSAACPHGQSQEDTVARLWNDPRYADVAARPAIETHLGKVSKLGKPTSANDSSTTRTLEELRKLYREHGMPASELE